MKKEQVIALFFVALLMAFVEAGVASEQAYLAYKPPFQKSEPPRASTREVLSEIDGLIMLDYEVIPVIEGESIDLHGVHYLQQLNDWLYLGIGLHAPLIYGNYGGFMAFDATLHVQQTISGGSSFVNAGVSLGGGGGGSSIKQSKVLSGTGGFVKSYLGFGYDFDNYSVGVNYTNFRFKKSKINHSQANLFFQRSVSYSIGSYALAGNQVNINDAIPKFGESILTVELNNIFQIRPKGRVKSTINTLALQFSHFSTENKYLFFGFDAGYGGLPLYNQAFSGFGYKAFVSPRVNIYGQIGVGSGGFAPSEIDTGSGLLVYPKVSLEYLFSTNLGLSLSSGLLVAPTGSSRNFTFGAALNYHRFPEDKQVHGFSDTDDMTYAGFRFKLFQQTEFNVQIGDKKHHDILMLTGQLDYSLNDYWYLPIQGSIAYNDFLGFPGYGEIFLGLGVQNKVSTDDGSNFFFQMLAGANIKSVLLKPSIGFNYSFSPNFSVHGELGKAIPFDKFNLFRSKYRLSSDFVGFGLMYRFSLLQ